MAAVESLQERQDNEMQALKAIYGQELQDLREKDAWNVWRPLELVVTLKPQQGSSGVQEVYAQIDLHVTCNETYPEMEPEISLEKSKGLSAQQLIQLKTELESLTKKQKGEVMIFELAQHVEKYLHLHNKPGFKSFYEEMMTRQQQQQQQQQLVMKQKEDKERQAIQGEIQRRQEALKEEQRLRKGQSRVLLDEIGQEDQVPAVERPRSTYVRTSSISRRRCQSTSESSEGSLCEHRGSQIMQFNNRGERQIRRGKCIGHSQRGCVVYSAMDLTTGEMLTVTEWSLKCRQPLSRKVTFRDVDSTDFANYMKQTPPDPITTAAHTSDSGYNICRLLSHFQVSSIEQELNYLYKLHHHNLVHYLNMKYIQEKENLVIYILQEFVFGSNLTFYLSENLPVDTDMLRHITLGVLGALGFLHQNNVVHKDLRDTSVFIDQLGVVRVMDYSLDKRLADMYQSSVQEKLENIYPPSLGRGGKKSDIYRLGILILSLFKGCVTTNMLPELPPSLQPDLKDFLAKYIPDIKDLKSFKFSL